MITALQLSDADNEGLERMVVKVVISPRREQKLRESDEIRQT